MSEISESKIQPVVDRFSIMKPQEARVTKTETQKVKEFLDKDTVNILVTDSGLGGVSVAADVYERLKKSGGFTKANVTFFNAQPHPEYGYNMMKTDEEKIAVFENALREMEEKCKPDILLIACNTLSVLYPETNYSKMADYPVVGIVETGVDGIRRSLAESPDADVFLFGTKTTVGQGTHKRMLIDMGINGDQVHTEACPGLAEAIQHDPHDEKTEKLVHKYVAEALEGYKGIGNPVMASLNCTHYGYASDVFVDEFTKQGFENVKIINPNPEMADFMFESGRSPKAEGTKTTIQIESHSELDPATLRAISGLISRVSPETARAMIADEVAKL